MSPIPVYLQRVSGCLSHVRCFHSKSPPKMHPCTGFLLQFLDNQPEILKLSLTVSSLSDFMFLLPPQTVEKWTLRDIQAKFRSSNANHSPQTQLHPPPIPIRRNVNGSGAISAPPPHLPPQNNSTSQAAGATPITVTLPDNTVKSRSAPSSPTEKSWQGNDPLEDQGAGQRMAVAAVASSGRPRSVAIDELDGSLQYTTIKFVDDVPHPPPTRRNTTYTDIKHPAMPKTIREGEEKGSDLTPEAEVRPLSPSYVSVGVCPPHAQHVDNMDSNDQEEEAAYDVPPPPVPVRFGSQNAPSSGSNPSNSPQDLNTSDSTSPCSPPTPVPRSTAQDSTSKKPPGAPEDPFTSQFGDPFFDTSWNDPTAFYDTPRSAKALNPPAELPVVEDSYMDMSRATTTATAATAAITATASMTADFTGDSSYEDTSSFLKDIRARYRNVPPEDVLAAGQGHSTEREMEDPAGATYDTPPVNNKDGIPVKSKLPSSMDEDSQFGSYDFPAALNRFPFRDDVCTIGESASGEKKMKEKGRDDPPLHTIQYSAQRPPPVQHSMSEVTGAGNIAPVTGVVRSESVSRGSRANVPLPPTPMENARGLESSGHEGPPPLPARQGVGIAHRPLPSRDPVPHKPATAQGGVVKPVISSRDTPLPPVPANDRPRLPRPNHPWGNRRQVSAQDNPPLPPRNKAAAAAAAAANGHSPEAGPGTTTPQHEEPAMLDLMSKGYQRADIESALRIARNDYELAKSILKEFGGRH